MRDAKANQRNSQGSGRLEGEVAIISGGSGGIGAAAADLFAREGARVAIHYSGLTRSSKERAEELAETIGDAGGVAMIVRANVSNYKEVKVAVKLVVKKLGKLSLAVCFAGLPSELRLWQEDSLELSDKELFSAINVDFLGAYHFINASKDPMRKNQYGKIVLISSTPTIYGEEEGYRFTLAKSLIRTTVKSLSMKLIRDYSIYLNAIAPGTVETWANKKNYSKEQWAKLISGIPLGRAGRADEVAKTALFLCSHDSDYILGQTVVVDGGETRL